MWSTGGERDSSIEAVINWLLENPDTSNSETLDSDRPCATATYIPEKGGWFCPHLFIIVNH
jgi:hypothetical protein